MSLALSSKNIALSNNALKYLNNYITKDSLIFQWGYSYLTFWMANRACKVYSSEYDYKKFCNFNFYSQNNAYHNIVPTFCTYSYFFKSIEYYPSKLFDVIVLENSIEKECLELAISNGKTNSIIVLNTITSLDLLLPLDNYFSNIEYMWDTNYKSTILTLK